MAISNPRRLILASIIGCALAILLLLQSLSSTTYKRAPELSLSLMPINGLAREQWAFAQFSAQVSEPEDTMAAAQALSGEALKVLESEPLAPKAFAILAMAEADPVRRKEILALGTQLNRRDLSLQSLWLTEKLDEGNFSQTAEALDRILRVHPQYREQFFPILGEALEDPASIPDFVRLLRGNAPWQPSFLNYASGQRQLQPNLALLRPQVELENEAIDRRLMIGLVRQGLYAEANELYTWLVNQPIEEGEEKTGPWRSAFPPFDWYFADSNGFRAQPSIDGDRLEISVRPGKGGVIAERFVAAPPGPFSIRITHRIAPIEQLRDVRLQANCAGSGDSYFDERFSQGEITFDLPKAPAECEFISLVINARAWSGRSALSGIIDTFEIITPSKNQAS